MFNAFYAILVLQYRSSIECLRRNLAANPTLMRVCGFPLVPNRKGYIRVPSKSEFSRFWKLLRRVEQKHSAVMGLVLPRPLTANRDLSEFWPNLGFDGKKLYSHSTGRTRADDGTCSDPAAASGRYQRIRNSEFVEKPPLGYTENLGQGSRIAAQVVFTPLSTPANQQIRLQNLCNGKHSI